MTGPTREQLLHLAERAWRGVLLPAEYDQLTAGISIMAAQLAELDGAANVAVSAVRLMNEAGARADRAEAAIERVLSPAGIRAAAEAMGDEALTHLGRDLGTIHVDHIAEAGLRAALDQAQQPTTTTCTCHTGDERCSGCRACPDICNGCR